MKVLVTGGRGFVGRRLCKELKEGGCTPIVFDIDDGDITQIDDFGAGIDYVYHLAGKTFIPDSWKNPASFYSVNVQGTVNVVEFCRKNGIGLTYLNTYGYGEPELLPISESAPLCPNTPYNHSKYVAEDIIQFYSKTFGVKAVSLRAFNIFGFGQSEIFLLPSLIKQTLDASAKEIHVKVLEPKRDYVYIDDVISALVATLKFEGRFSAYNIGSGRSYSVKEVAETIMRLAGVSKPLIADGQIRPNDVPDVVADISKIKRELGWSPSVGFEEGLRRMIEETKCKR